MAKARNVLFIMCDQLRWDYLGCYGHPHLETPNIDALAARGVRFDRAYAQSTICGPSRMSFYTGRYVHSHGSTWNSFPLRVGEPTLGDHLEPLGVRTALVGKTHMKADHEGMDRLGIVPQSAVGTRVAECGFEPYDRDDGLHPDGPYDPDGPYNAYLREQGFGGDNPWHAWANSGGTENDLRSGWFMENARLAARVPEEHSETAYTTNRAMDFIREAGDESWCLHLSYIKPHWPYIAPAPYNAMYGTEHVMPAVRDNAEQTHGHPLFRAFQKERVCRAFSRDDVRENVIPTYMGMVRQIDDHMGRLFAFLEEQGLMENTLIVFTSDHGDYLGDHWLGEKELFHEQSVRLPMIVYDPSDAADTTRGTVNTDLVEAIDLAPTFLDFLGGQAKPHILEGRSLLPLTRGERPDAWRSFVISEYDYAMRSARIDLRVPIGDARMTMVFDGRWKAVIAKGFPDMLFDLENDPDELHDLGTDPAHAEVRAHLRECILDWALRASNRITVTDERIDAIWDKEADVGILIGYWSEEEA